MRISPKQLLLVGCGLDAEPYGTPEKTADDKLNSSKNINAFSMNKFDFVTTWSKIV